MTPFYSNRIDQIDRLLPQTQCTQCGYPRCRDYAAAIDANEADINQCPPGAQITIQALATFTGKPPKPLNPSHGAVEPKMVALVDESACIGCKLCIQACPVDCIIGANKRMHTVIAGECTGCKLCVPVCPTDCIRLMPAPLPDPATAPSLWPAFSQDQIDRARGKTAQKLSRDRTGTKWPKANSAAHSRQTLQQEIQAALVRKSRSRRKGSLSRTSGTDR